MGSVVARRQHFGCTFSAVKVQVRGPDGRRATPIAEDSSSGGPLGTGSAVLAAACGTILRRRENGRNVSDLHGGRAARHVRSTVAARPAVVLSEVVEGVSRPLRGTPLRPSLGHLAGAFRRRRTVPNSKSSSRPTIHGSDVCWEEVHQRRQVLRCVKVLVMGGDMTGQDAHPDRRHRRWPIRVSLTWPVRTHRPPRTKVAPTPHADRGYFRLLTRYDHDARRDHHSPVRPERGGSALSKRKDDRGVTRTMARDSRGYGSSPAATYACFLGPWQMTNPLFIDGVLCTGRVASRTQRGRVVELTGRLADDAAAGGSNPTTVGLASRATGRMNLRRPAVEAEVERIGTTVAIRAIFNLHVSHRKDSQLDKGGFTQARPVARDRRRRARPLVGPPSPPPSGPLRSET
jgi:hypothetical protein